MAVYEPQGVMSGGPTMMDQVRDAINTLQNFSLSKMFEPQTTQDYQGTSIKFPNLGMGPQAAGALSTVLDPTGIMSGPIGFNFQAPVSYKFMQEAPKAIEGLKGWKGGTVADLIRFVGDKMEGMAPNAAKITKRMLVEFLPEYMEQGKMTGKVGALEKGPNLPQVGSAQLYGTQSKTPPSMNNIGSLVDTFAHEAWGHGLYSYIPELREEAQKLWASAPGYFKEELASLYSRTVPKEEAAKLVKKGWILPGGSQALSKSSEYTGKVTAYPPESRLIEEYFSYNMGNTVRKMMGLGESPHFTLAPEDFSKNVMRILTDSKTRVMDPEATLASFSGERPAYSMDEISKSFKDATQRYIQQSKAGGVVGSRKGGGMVGDLSPRTPQEAVKEKVAQRKRIKEVDVKGHTAEAASSRPMYSMTNQERAVRDETFINKIVADSRLTDPNKIAKLRELLQNSLSEK